MSIIWTRTTIEEAQRICIGCNAGRVTEDGRPKLDPGFPLNELSFRRPGAIAGHSFCLCDECLDDLRWVILPDTAIPGELP